MLGTQVDSSLLKLASNRCDSTVKQALISQCGYGPVDESATTIINHPPKLYCVLDPVLRRFKHKAFSQGKPKRPNSIMSCQLIGMGSEELQNKRHSQSIPDLMIVLFFKNCPSCNRLRKASAKTLQGIQPQAAKGIHCLCGCKT